MITKEKLDKIDQCRHLLDAPAPEVIGELITEIRRLIKAQDDALLELDQLCTENLAVNGLPSIAETIRAGRAHLRHNAPVDLPDTAAQDSASKSNNPAVSG